MAISHSLEARLNHLVRRFVTWPLFSILAFVFMSACSGGGGSEPPPPPPVTDSSLVINANRISGAAPLAVIFETTESTSTRTTRPFHDVLYTWDFGDSTSGSKWTYGAREGTASKNTDRGPIAGHLFEQPGNYTVTLKAFDGITERTISKTITVTNPDEVYAGANTICIGQSSVPLAGDPGVPAGALCVQESTWAGVVSRMAAGKRILLRRGDTWDVPANGAVPTGASAVPTRIGAFGVGANPRLNLSAAVMAFSLMNPQSGYEFFDLDFQGTNNITSNGINGSGQAGVVVVRCSADLVASPIKLGGNDIFIQDNNFHDMLSLTPASLGGGNLGIWISNSERLAILGNRVYNARAIEHNIRTQGAGKAVYAHNFISGPAVQKHALALRGKTDPNNPLNKTYPEITRYVLVQDNLIESGGSITDRLVQIGPQAPLYQEILEDVIVEGNRLQGAWGTGIFSEVAARLNVRNNLFSSSASSAVGLSVNFGNQNGVPAASDTRFDHNSLYLEGSKASAAAQYSAVSTQPTGLVVRNNVLYAPNATKNSLNSGPTAIYASNVPAENVVLGINSSNSQITSTAPGWSVYPPSLNTDWVPTAAYILDSAAPVAVWDDFFGVKRAGAADLGAVQP